MRIGIVVDTFNFGGAESVVFETARLLKESGHEPILLHFGSDYVLRFATQLNLTSHVIPNHHLYKKGIYLPVFALRTAHFIDGLKLDLLHSHLFGPIVAFSLVCRLISLPHFGTLHDIYTIVDNPGRIRLIKLSKWLGTHLIAVSRQMLNFYEDSANFSAGTITFIPNFAEQNEHKTSRSALRSQLGLNSKDVAIMSVGRVVPLKRFDLLIDAIKFVNKGVNCRAFIVGSGPDVEKLKQRVLDNDLELKVIFLGERNDVVKLLVAADIFTLTSETEGMSKSILEALAAGLPIIATDVGGNSELVNDGKNGYLINHNVFEFAYRLNQLVSDSSLRESMGEQSRLIMESRFTETMFLERHLSLYSNI